MAREEEFATTDTAVSRLAGTKPLGLAADAWADMNQRSVLGSMQAWSNGRLWVLSSASVDQLKTFNAVNVSVGFLLKPDRTGQDVQSGFFRFAMRRRARSSKKAGIVS